MEKLREEELELSKRLIVSMNKNLELNSYKSVEGIKYNLISNLELIKIVKDFIQEAPKHETVEQWEKRTGETYPDDGPVWVNTSVDYWGSPSRVEWTVVLYEAIQDKNICIVANHHGKPDSEGER